MKNLSIVLNTILIVAVAVLFYLHFSGGTQTEVKTIAGEGAVVYVDTDSLLLNYKLSIDLNEKLLKKQEDSRTDFNFKAQKLEKEVVDFQNKVQNNGFLSRERAENAQRDLLEKRESLEQLERKLSSELMIEQNENSKRLFDSISNYLQLYNAKHKFNLIISTSKGGTVLHAADGLDITADVIKGLNARYKK